MYSESLKLSKNSANNKIKQLKKINETDTTNKLNKKNINNIFPICLLGIIVIANIFVNVIFQSKVKAFSPTSNQIYEGIDISSWQKNINFMQVKSAGIQIVYIKASQGTNYINPYLESYYNGAKSNGLKVGFYHYVTAKNTDAARKEAEFFINAIAGKSSDCLLAMDFENFYGLNNYQINSIAETFLYTLKSITNKGVIIYSNANNAINTFNRSLSIYPLWVANYDVSEPRANGKWNNWTGFQYTDEGIISGINGYVDRDKFTNNIFLSDTSTIRNTTVENWGNSNSIDNSNGNNKNGINYNSTTTITIKNGDTLSQIASEYNTTVKELTMLNNIANPNLIYAGNKLIVPILSNYNISNTTSNYSSGYMYYKIQRGNTLSQIAYKYGTSVSILVTLNNIKNQNLIYTGNILIIPNNKSSQTNDMSHILYVVKRGNTLSQIAIKYNTTVNKIVELNQIKNPNLIYPGQILRIRN